VARCDQSRRCNSLVVIGGIADTGMRWSRKGSVANDPERSSASKTKGSVSDDPVDFDELCHA
jgi:hypothetical protein